MASHGQETPKEFKKQLKMAVKEGAGKFMKLRLLQALKKERSAGRVL
jgi:hypothetical protein